MLYHIYHEKAFQIDISLTVTKDAASHLPSVNNPFSQYIGWLVQKKSREQRKTHLRLVSVQ
jgi:hypothetical protein